MYQKAVLFNDETVAKQILATSDPKKQKALGKKVSNFSGETWDKHKFDIVVQANTLKFGGKGLAVEDDRFVYGSVDKAAREDITMREILLSTGDRELVEASPLDKIWGIGFDPQKAVYSARNKWGQNLLGKALMEVRKKLRNEDTVDQSSDE